MAMGDVSVASPLSCACCGTGNLGWRPAGCCCPTWTPLAATLVWLSSISFLHPLQGEQMSELLVCKSMEMSVELQVTLNLYMRKSNSLRTVPRPRFSAFLGSILHDARRSSEVAADNKNEAWGAKMEALEANLATMMISNRWYAELSLHHGLIANYHDVDEEARLWPWNIWPRRKSST